MPGRVPSELFAWLRTDQRQPAAGIELLASFQRFFFAVGFDLNGCCGVSRLDYEFVEQSHGAGAFDPVVARPGVAGGCRAIGAAKSPGP